MLHPAVLAFMEKHEKVALSSGNYRHTLGSLEQQFLQDVWGPAFQFNFEGLKAEYPFRDYRGGDRFADCAYENGGIRLIMELDGFTTHAREISPGDFDDHLMRQNDLNLAGWMTYDEGRDGCLGYSAKSRHSTGDATRRDIKVDRRSKIMGDGEKNGPFMVKTV